jgi:hypothetical protein
MAAYADREHFIPLTLPDLIEFLAVGRGANVDPEALPETEQKQFRHFASSIQSHFHHKFHRLFRQIKESYAYFDPDLDTPTLTQLSADDESEAQRQFFESGRALLAKANYRHLSRSDAVRMMQATTFWGIQLDVSWDVFEELETYYRGDSIQPREIRRWTRLWLKQTIQVPVFERLVVVFKQKDHKRLGKKPDCKSIFLKMFKEIPQGDLETILPGTRPKLTKVDKGLIIYPLASGLGLLLYKLLSDVFNFRDIFAITASVSLSWSLAIAFAGYGYKTFRTYSNKKISYALRLTQSLYYQSIDNNAGVFHRLIDEAEEQESREAILAYFFLWKKAPHGMTAAKLDDAIEEDLERRLNLKVDFEIVDALDKLEALKIVRKENDIYQAIPLDQIPKRSDHSLQW